MEESVVSNFYADQHVLITGATGFLGKVLVEKLLRFCPSISKIYVVVRPKRDEQPSSRFIDILSSPVFDKIREQPDHEALFTKLQLLQGDLVEKDLRLSNEDLNVLRSEVTIIFHTAATVRFDEPLKLAATINIGGTKNLLDLACTFRKLKAFVHVSTAYCHPNQKKLEEKLYRAPHNPIDILNLVSWMDEDLLNIVTSKLLKGFPNTYIYTKCLTEQLVSEYSSKLPLVITRPTIVTAAWKEPSPGWVDNYNGPTLIIAACGKGLLKSLHFYPELQQDVVPVDCVINSLVLIAWKLGQNRGSIKVYNLTASAHNLVTSGRFSFLILKFLREIGFKGCLWYPSLTLIPSYHRHVVADFYCHKLPAYALDLFMVATRRKPFFVRTQNKFRQAMNSMKWVTSRQWYFHNENVAELWKELNETDQNVFYTDGQRTDFDRYILNYVLGVRKLCTGEGVETLLQTEKIMERLFLLDVLLNMAGLTFLLFIILKCASLL